MMRDVENAKSRLPYPRSAPSAVNSLTAPSDSPLTKGEPESIRVPHNVVCEKPLLYRADVVIPYHPANLQWLSTSVDSVLNQNGVECIVHLIADGFHTEDDPAARYADLPHVRWYRNEKSIGPYLSLHRVFDRLETDVIALQDSDDIALPNRLRLSGLSHGKSLP